MFSKRLNWNAGPNRISEMLCGKRATGAKILDLTESNPTLAALSYPETELLAAFSDRRSLIYEPQPAGSMEARAAISAYYAAHGHSVPVERILLTTSTSESYGYLFKLLADPGDEILAPRPSYPLFEFLASLESVHVTQYPLVYNHVWWLDLEALVARTTPRTRAVVLVNPNNPTGSFLKRDELGKLVRHCADRGLAIISDEVFSDYTFADDPRRVASLVDVSGVPVFCLGGLSKAAALPQMKLGWIVLNGPPDYTGYARSALELIGDTYLTVGTPVQHALPRLLGAAANLRNQIAIRVRENLASLRFLVTRGCSCEVLDVEGGWYATLRVPRIRSEEEWCLQLLELDDVLVQPGFFYDFETEAFLVLSLLTPREVFQEGAQRLLRRCG